MNLTTRLLVWLLFTAAEASAQNQYPFRRVYTMENADGSVYILADNHGTMPFTALIRAKLTHMRSSVPLPFRVTMLPGDKPYVLAIFIPDKTGTPSWNYTQSLLDGIYTGHLPDTSYVYRLPYQVLADTVLPNRARVSNASGYYLYAFGLPENTPICAARAGTIVAIKQKAKNFKDTNDNLIFVQHDDGSYSSYENISKNSVVGQAGRQVVPGDVIGYFGGNKKMSTFYFGVYYTGDSTTMTVPVKFQVSKRIIRPKEGKASIYLK